MIDAGLPPTDMCLSTDPDAGYVGGIARGNASVQGIAGCPFDPPATFDMLLRQSPDPQAGPLPWNAAFVLNEHDNYGACPGYAPTDRVHTCFTFGAWTGLNDEDPNASPLFALTITYAGGPPTWSKCYGAPPCPVGFPEDLGGVCCQAAGVSTSGNGGYQFTLLPLAVLDFDGGASSGPDIGIPGIDPDPVPPPPPPLPEPLPEASAPATPDASADVAGNTADAIAPEASALVDAGDQVEASAPIAPSSSGSSGCSMGMPAPPLAVPLWAVALSVALLLRTLRERRE